MKSLKATSLLVVSLLFLTACNSQNSFNDADNAAIDTKPSQTRYILKTQRVDELREEIKGQAGFVRSLDHISGVVAHLPQQAIDQLQVKFADLDVEIDQQIFLIDGKPENPGNGKDKETTSTQPSQTIPWGVTKIGAVAKHSVATGSGVKVCVVDTGIDKTHPDLSANIVGGKNYVWAKGKTDPTKWNDDNGHGSHVAGTIAALDNTIGALGVAPDAQLIAIKVLDKNGSGYFSDVADGILECASQGADIINMSLGASGDPSADNVLKQAVQSAYADGVIIVSAAGNESTDIAGKIPAGYPESLAIAASNSNNSIAGFSNYGLDLADYTAPGVYIPSTWKNGGYNTISGTSMAAPHVAGALALWLSNSNITLGADDIGYETYRQGAGLIQVK